MLLNHNIKPIKCWLRKEYLYNLESHQNEFEECHIFAISSIKGRALGLHAFLNTGAVFYRLPLSAFVWKKTDLQVPIDYLQTWDQLGYHLSVIEYDFLKELNGKVFLKNGKWENCEYMFTVDFCHPDSSYLNTTFVESPQDHKCQHIVKLKNGYFGAYPNNKILWEEIAFVTKKMEGRPDYKVNTHKFHAENGGYMTSDDDRFFYDFIEKETKCEVSNSLPLA
ncbi:MAG: hypothetical protein H6620_05290 [Halobacteriovoraceae bacterium]|nr:hypothetical protein [Halobacteriovoraceae bacterium]